MATLVVVLSAILVCPWTQGRAGEVPSFLVAKTSLNDPLFQRSVILMFPASITPLVAGVIIIKPTTIPVKRVFTGSIDLESPYDVIYFGGPVDMESSLLIRETSEPTKSEIHILKNLYLSSDPKQIAQLLKSRDSGQSHMRVFLGYSQWTKDQLEAEKMEDSWYQVPARPELLFSDVPSDLWKQLVDSARLLKVNTRAEGAVPHFP